MLVQFCVIAMSVQYNCSVIAFCVIIPYQTFDAFVHVNALCTLLRINAPARVHRSDILQTLEDRLARRRELAEQNRMSKQTSTDIVTAKVQNQANALQILVNNSTITEKEKDAIMERYEKDLWRVHTANEQGTSSVGVARC